MKSYQQLFAELKRRKVFKVAGIYGIVSFGVLQAADLMLPRLGVPDWTVTFMVALVVLAFPVALLLAWAFEVTPDGVKRTDAAAPGEIEGIMAAPASQRWPSGLLALVGVVALVGTTWWIARRTAPEASVAAAHANLVSGMRLVDLADDVRPSIAVLPFADMSSTQDQEYFGDGMSEAVLNVLTQGGNLRVAGRTSAFAYKGDRKDLREIGTELGVTYLVEGSVAKEGDQVRITAQLIDATDNSHLWSDQYFRPLTNIFEIQSEISSAIADALRVSLGLNDTSDLVTPTADLEAYDLYLAGRSRLRERGQGTFDAIELFEAAVARDSNWAPAWAGLADAMEISTWQTQPYDSAAFYQTWDAAERAARRALELQPQNSAALVALGSIHRDRLQWSEAERFYRQALDLDPDNAEAHQQYGEWLAKRGRLAEAVLSLDRASALDPAPIRIAQLIFVLVQDGRWDDAEDVLDWALGQDMGGDYFAFDDDQLPLQLPIQRAVEEARYEDQIRLVFDADPDLSAADTVGWSQYVIAMREGRMDLLPDSLHDRINLAPYDYVVLNEYDLAVDKYIEGKSGSPLRIDGAWWSLFDPIRSHARFQAYMASIGLGGLTVQRTPVEERVRPAILRQADAAAVAASEGSSP
jgi:TolB-like protein